MKYIDGFLLPVPNARKDDYLVLAKKMAVINKGHSALLIHECWEQFDRKRMMYGGFDMVLADKLVIGNFP